MLVMWFKPILDETKTAQNQKQSLVGIRFAELTHSLILLCINEGLFKQYSEDKSVIFILGIHNKSSDL